MTLYIAGQSNGSMISRGDIYQSYASVDTAPTQTSLDKYVWGGAPLAPISDMDWYPGVDNDPDTGELYDGFTDLGESVTGILWVQGEGDKNDDRSESYAENLEALIEGFQQSFGNVPIVVVALSSYAPIAEDDRYAERWETIREAQLAISAEFPEVQVIDPDAVAATYGYSAEEMYRDSLHYSTEFGDLLMATALPYLVSETSTLQIGTDGSDFLKGCREDDQIDGSFGDDKIRGGNGDDTLYGSYGNDWLIGNLGDDVLRGSYGCDILSGHAGNDILIGDGDGEPDVFTDDCNDILRGNLGDDTLIGGRGDDILSGGRGSDVFVFTCGDGNDIVGRLSNGTYSRDFGEGDLLDFTDMAGHDVVMTETDIGVLIEIDDITVTVIGTLIEDIAYLI